MAFCSHPLAGQAAAESLGGFPPVTRAAPLRLCRHCRWRRLRSAFARGLGDFHLCSIGQYGERGGVTQTCGRRRGGCHVEPGSAQGTAPGVPADGGPSPVPCRRHTRRRAHICSLEPPTILRCARERVPPQVAAHHRPPTPVAAPAPRVRPTGAWRSPRPRGCCPPRGTGARGAERPRPSCRCPRKSPARSPPAGWMRR